VHGIVLSTFVVQVLGDLGARGKGVTNTTTAPERDEAGEGRSRAPSDVAQRNDTKAEVW